MALITETVIFPEERIISILAYKSIGNDTLTIGIVKGTRVTLNSCACFIVLANAIFSAGYDTFLGYEACNTRTIYYFNII